jgi:FMN-dependent NADH-azoreductase
VIVASSRGGIYSAGPAIESDFQERYLRAVFALIGVTDVTFVRAEGVAVSAEHREAALIDALASVGDLGRSVAPALAA